MSNFINLTVPDFTGADTDGVLAGAALLEDIERYRKVKAIFEADQQRERHCATVILPAKIKAVSTNLNLDAWLTAGLDPHVELDKRITQYDTIAAKIKVLCEGTAYKKLERRYDALVDFHSDLSERLSFYQANLGTNALLAMLLDDGDVVDG